MTWMPPRQQSTIDLPKLVQRRFARVQINGAHGVSLPQGSLVQIRQRM